jgi:DNA-binding winged helix-turn-helix (wHTH) protein/TolB-like protein
VDTLVRSQPLWFGNFRFDRRVRKLARRNLSGEWEPVALGSRAGELLALLTDKPGEVVSRDAMMDAVWPGLAVETNNMTVQMAALRRVLDEGRVSESCIQTVPGRGYRFVLQVTRAEERHLSLVGSPPIALQSVLIEPPTGVPSTSTAGIAATSDPAQDRRQSVIVLPFKNTSGEAAQDGLAADLTHEVTDRITRGVDPIGPVIPEMTAAAYRGKEVDLVATGRQHDVHFVLIGDAYRCDGRLIVSAILYETAGGRTVWSRQFDRQDGRDARQAIVQTIYESFWQTSVDEEVERSMRERPNNLDKRDLVLMAVTTRMGVPTKAHYQEKIALIERALARDPNDFVGLERQARCHSELVLLGYSSDPVADLAIASEAADRMLTTDPNNLLALRARSKVLHAQGRWREAESVLRRVIDLQPAEANRRLEFGQILMAQGRHQEALDNFQAAKRFAGGSDLVYTYDAGIAMASLAVGHFAAAIDAARRSMSASPSGIGRLGEIPWLALISAESGCGEDEAARTDLQKFLTTPRTWHTMVAIEEWPEFAANPKLLGGLRHAGMPEDQGELICMHRFRRGDRTSSRRGIAS